MSDQIALYYMRINGIDYYYSYNLLKDTNIELKDSYKLVDIKHAFMLLRNQME